MTPANCTGGKTKTPAEKVRESSGTLNILNPLISPDWKIQGACLCSTSFLRPLDLLLEMVQKMTNFEIQEIQVLVSTLRSQPDLALWGFLGGYR